MKLALTLLLALHGAVALAQGQSVPPPKCALDGNYRSPLMVFHSHVGRGHNQQHIDWLLGGGTLANIGTHLVLYNGEETESWQLVAMDDFDGNGTCDLFWERPAEITVTLTSLGGPMAAPLPVDPQSIPGEGPGWSLVGSGHFNHDGRADLLWWNADIRRLRVWQLTEWGVLLSVTELEEEAPPPPWEASAVVDLAGDGRAGILWRNTDTGQLSYWRMREFQLIETLPVSFDAWGIVGLRWRLAATGDFNGDGRDDLIWQERGEQGEENGRVAVWFMHGTTQSLESLLEPDLLRFSPLDPPGTVRGPR